MALMTRHLLASCAALALLAGLSAPALANPKGGQLVAGQASIADTGPKELTITQGTDRAAINWQSFDIEADERTRIIQPDGQSVLLNRVTGSADASRILGQLQANGRVILQNPNGILFGPGSRVDVNGLLATTHDIRTEDFMDGKYDFHIPGNPNAAIMNEGTITAAEAGVIALVAPGVDNRGILNARLGKVTLASGDAFTLDFYGDDLIKLVVDRKTAEGVPMANGQPLSALVSNSGTITADGGIVSFTAHAVRGMMNTAINMDGIARAQSVSAQGGRIVLHGGDAGIVQVAGTLDVSGGGAGETGGAVAVLGEYVGLIGDAIITADGYAGGGTVRIGGDYQGQPGFKTAKATVVGTASEISADATAAGNGGVVVVWSDEVTAVQGKLSARGGALSGDGGLIETSSKGKLHVQASPDAGAAHGKAGTWLLDPANLIVRRATSSGANTGSCNGGVCGGTGSLLDSPDLRLVPGDFSYFSSAAADSIVNAADIEAVLNQGTSVELSTIRESQGTGGLGLLSFATPLLVSIAGRDSAGAGSGSAPGEGGLDEQADSQPGNISIEGAITKSAGGDATLALSATGSIQIEAPIVSTSGALNLDVFSQQGRITSNQTVQTNGGAIFLDAPGNIEFDNRAATRLGDLTITAHGGSGAANVNVRWGGDRVQFTHDGQLANIPTNGIFLDASATTQTNFQNLDVVYRNTAVTLGTTPGNRFYYFLVPDGVYGAAQPIDGVPEFVGFDLMTFGPGRTNNQKPGITPYFEVSDITGFVRGFSVDVDLPSPDPLIDQSRLALFQGMNVTQLIEAIQLVQINADITDLYWQALYVNGQPTAIQQSAYNAVVQAGLAADPFRALDTDALVREIQLVRIDASTSNPIWRALYVNGQATANQVSAFLLVANANTTADPFRPLNADQLVQAIRRGDVLADEDNIVWRALYANGQATATPVAAFTVASQANRFWMMTSAQLAVEIRAGRIVASGSNAVWRSLYDNGQQSAIQRAALAENERIRREQEAARRQAEEAARQRADEAKRQLEADALRKLLEGDTAQSDPIAHDPKLLVNAGMYGQYPTPEPGVDQKYYDIFQNGLNVFIDELMETVKELPKDKAIEIASPVLDEIFKMNTPFAMRLYTNMYIEQIVKDYIVIINEIEKKNSGFMGFIKNNSAGAVSLYKGIGVGLAIKLGADLAKDQFPGESANALIARGLIDYGEELASGYAACRCVLGVILGSMWHTGTELVKFAGETPTRALTIQQTSIVLSDSIIRSYIFYSIDENKLAYSTRNVTKNLINSSKGVFDDGGVANEFLSGLIVSSTASGNYYENVVEMTDMVVASQREKNRGANTSDLDDRIEAFAKVRGVSDVLDDVRNNVSLSAKYF